ncbi:hypothetical protein D6B98_30680 [Bradyrhizobium sp. LVM 105]|nr:hypothetical protein D6B98_30680 [Bradyrhizobium sp. LVM 105]
MVVVSLLVLTTGAGGYARNFAGLFVLFSMFWGLPLLTLISLFHFLDKRFGPRVGPWPTSHGQLAMSGFED